VEINSTKFSEVLLMIFHDNVITTLLHTAATKMLKLMQHRSENDCARKL